MTAVLLADRRSQVNSELLTSKGRIDMSVKTDDKVFIIEFKCNQNVEKAIEQIRERNYVDKYGLNYSY